MACERLPAPHVPLGCSTPRFFSCGGLIPPRSRSRACAELWEEDQSEGEDGDDLPAHVVLENGKHGDKVQEHAEPKSLLHLDELSFKDSLDLRDSRRLDES